MGMNYVWSDSASYVRFEIELTEIAKIFGGQRRIRRPIFIFPDGTNESLVKWFNNVYEYFTKEETKIIWELISAYPEIKEISLQIWNELEKCVEFESGWYIH